MNEKRSGTVSVIDSMTMSAPMPGIGKKPSGPNGWLGGAKLL